MSTTSHPGRPRQPRGTLPQSLPPASPEFIAAAERAQRMDREKPGAKPLQPFAGRETVSITLSRSLLGWLDLAASASLRGERSILVREALHRFLAEEYSSLMPETLAGLDPRARAEGDGPGFDLEGQALLELAASVIEQVGPEERTVLRYLLRSMGRRGR